MISLNIAGCLGRADFFFWRKNAKEKVFLEASFDMTINNFFMVNSCNFSGETPLKFRLFSGDARMRTRRGLWRASRQGK